MGKNMNKEDEKLESKLEYYNKWQKRFFLATIAFIIGGPLITRFELLPTSFGISILFLGLFLVLPAARLFNIIENHRKDYLKSKLSKIKLYTSNGEYDSIIPVLEDINSFNESINYIEVKKYTKAVLDSKNKETEVKNSIEDFIDILENNLNQTPSEKMEDLAKEVKTDEESYWKEMISDMTPEYLKNKKFIFISPIIFAVGAWHFTSDITLTAAAAIGTFILQIMERLFSKESE